MSDLTSLGAAAAVPVGAVPAAGVDPALASFIYTEARLADEARYSQWEALWDDDAKYWVPMHPDHDPRVNVSYIYDNRRRIRSRVAQLNSGNRHSQTPPSVLRRLITNLEVVAQDSDTMTLAANFVIYEYRIRARGGDLKLAAKTVHLVNAGGPVPTMSFLI
ncbi:aromatic-ring-hydroxylating dioxygenase subunit beta [Candidatus Frankia alpina]|uniref:Ring-hydroxylating dioxygenase subunit beta n=1 Tax=Candidatus Frankia alpina TaxID=2699483 RepID=A0A4S5ESH4_9ACTN|nr:aromatic-ring-hydroxylating dioxygenase subunit beta [Candidatus Frankia alpina]THJ75475.1 ring-hydroxylating dioxygenase subunit beta [Candidatus Frankia alpina]